MLIFLLVRGHLGPNVGEPEAIAEAVLGDIPGCLGIGGS